MATNIADITDDPIACPTDLVCYDISKWDAPVNISSWIIDGVNVVPATGWTVNEVQELLDNVNNVDPNGQWVCLAKDKLCLCVVTGREYGPITLSSNGNDQIDCPCEFLPEKVVRLLKGVTDPKVAAAIKQLSIDISGGGTDYTPLLEAILTALGGELTVTPGSGWEAILQAAFEAALEGAENLLQALCDKLDAGITVNATQSGEWTITGEVALDADTLSALEALLDAANDGTDALLELISELIGDILADGISVTIDGGTITIDPNEVELGQDTLDALEALFGDLNLDVTITGQDGVLTVELSADTLAALEGLTFNVDGSTVSLDQDTIDALSDITVTIDGQNGPIEVTVSGTVAVTQDGEWTVELGQATLDALGALTLMVTGEVSLDADTLAALEEITVNGTVELGALTLAALENITATVSGTVELGPDSLAALENITVTVSGLPPVVIDAGQFQALLDAIAASDVDDTDDDIRPASPICYNWVLDETSGSFVGYATMDETGAFVEYVVLSGTPPPAGAEVECAPAREVISVSECEIPATCTVTQLGAAINSIVTTNIDVSVSGTNGEDVTVVVSGPAENTVRAFLTNPPSGNEEAFVLTMGNCSPFGYYDTVVEAPTNTYKFKGKGLASCDAIQTIEDANQNVDCTDDASGTAIMRWTPGFISGGSNWNVVKYSNGEIESINCTDGTIVKGEPAECLPVVDLGTQKLCEMVALLSCPEGSDTGAEKCTLLSDNTYAAVGSPGLDIANANAVGHQIKVAGMPSSSNAEINAAIANGHILQLVYRDAAEAVLGVFVGQPGATTGTAAGTNTYVLTSDGTIVDDCDYSTTAANTTGGGTWATVQIKVIIP